ncbi:hypothetical protein M8I34_20660 [Streptomyces sp. MCA2]|uniref:hypothetical protein n=1 Tax=Streptomyces sp. MCA2 TaxID=2944805 RepID=UPI0020210994|nr:hypothetical protein [Streptomyces sp. MCA2]MCL7493788.1 hypothetical protein [Streptomyces sp. MCA2]
MSKPPSPRSRSAYGFRWPANRRIAIVALALTVLLAIAGGAALLTGRSEQPPEHPIPTSSSPPPAPDRPVRTGSVPKPPQTSDPVAYAKAAATMLWSYDTRNTSRGQQLDGMQAWMTGEAKYADWTSVSGQVPDPVLWSRMADQDQHATGTAAEGHFPSTFKQALADDPSAITEAYVYVVTVNGKQKMAWKKHGGGAEERAITLAVQCRPHHDCSLAAISPRVAP